MSLSNAEIAERLDGMKRRGVSVERGIGNTMAVCKVFPHKDGVFQVIKLPFLYSSDLLAFCRAVVERVQEKCRWKQDDTGDWFTRCGEGWTFTDGGVAENRIKFCPYCGKPIEAVEYKEPMEET